MSKSQSAKTIPAPVVITEIYEGKLQFIKSKDKKGRGTYSSSYCIYNKVKATNDNITEILDAHYKNEDIIHINIVSKVLDEVYMFDRTGILEIRKDEGMYDLFLEDTNLDGLLWNIVGDEIQINIESKESNITQENDESEDTDK